MLIHRSDGLTKTVTPEVLACLKKPVQTFPVDPKDADLRVTIMSTEGMKDAAEKVVAAAAKKK